MKLPINIQTKEGIDTWHSLMHNREWSKENGMFDWYKTFLAVEGVKKEKELINWLEGYDLGSYDYKSSVWQTWKQMADVVACYNYIKGLK